MIKVAQKQTNKSSALIGQSKALFFIVAGLIALTTFGVYWQVGGHEFISYDDPKYVTENSHVQSGLTLAGLKWAFTKGHAANWHPLTWLSHTIELAKASGDDELANDLQKRLVLYKTDQPYLQPAKR